MARLLDGTCSHVEAKQDYVAFPHHVVSALEAEGPFALCGLERTQLHHVPVGNNFRLDESLLDICMNRSRGSLGGRSPGDGPGANFRLAGGVKGKESEQIVGLLDYSAQPAAFETKILHEQSRVFVRERRNLAFYLAANGRDPDTAHGGKSIEMKVPDGLVDFGNITLVQVQRQKERLGRQECEALDPSSNLLGDLHVAQRLLLFQCRLETPERALLDLEVRALRLFEILLEPFQPLIDDSQIGNDHFQLEQSDVPRRIDGCRAPDRLRFEGSQYVEQGVHVLQAVQIHIHFVEL